MTAFFSLTKKNFFLTTKTCFDVLGTWYTKYKVPRYSFA